MRQKTNKRGILNYLTIILLSFLLILTLSTICVQAAEKPTLEINRDDWIVEPNEQFSVTVTDQNGTKIQDAEVTIDNGMKEIETNSNGVAYLIAPSKEGRYQIVATKNGYSPFKGEIRVDAGPPFWETTTFPIILGGICLIGAIIFVYFREKRSIYNRATQISKDNILQKYATSQNNTTNKEQPTQTKNQSNFNENKKDIYQNPYHPKPIRSTHENDSKVEEIRIRRPHKEREVVSVEKEKDVAEKVVQDAKMKKRDDDWFQGNEDAKYEIGKITGEVDEEQIDKWFEGYDNLKEKIDEKVKKDKKKRKKDEED